MSSRSVLFHLALGLVTTVAAAPCDIYASGNTPCVAAHSTTRALYSNYNGPLYQVTRHSDGKTSQIAPLSKGGVANAATQDSFCKGTTCLISVIYDQSGHSNHLTQAPPGSAGGGSAANGYDSLSNATAAPVTVNGKKAYGVAIAPGGGYRQDKTTGVAKGDAAEGMYALFDGTDYNNQCCFDYGNAEANNIDNGNGHMEALYFGSNSGTGSGAGPGPWIMADMENNLFSGGVAGNNQGDPSHTGNFIFAALKGESNHWALRGGDGSSGSVSTYYSGVRPANGYKKMVKEGAIILGIGGDNSHGAQGTFFEGAMTSGFPSDSTENSIQANVVAQKYIKR